MDSVLSLALSLIAIATHPPPSPSHDRWRAARKCHALRDRECHGKSEARCRFVFWEDRKAGGQQDNCCFSLRCPDEPSGARPESYRVMVNYNLEKGEKAAAGAAGGGAGSPVAERVSEARRREEGSSEGVEDEYISKGDSDSDSFEEVEDDKEVIDGERVERDTSKEEGEEEEGKDISDLVWEAERALLKGESSPELFKHIRRSIAASSSQAPHRYRCPTDTAVQYSRCKQRRARRSPASRYMSSTYPTRLAEVPWLAAVGSTAQIDRTTRRRANQPYSTYIIPRRSIGRVVPSQLQYAHVRQAD